MSDRNVVPLRLSADVALRTIRQIAVDSANVIVPSHAKLRMRQRGVTLRQIEACLERGTISEGPYGNAHGNWQVNLRRHAAGEELTLAVAIEWATKVLVVAVF